MVGGLEQGSAEGTGRGADGPYSAGSTRSKSAGTGTSAWQRHIGPSEGVRLVPKLVGLARLAPTLLSLRIHIERAYFTEEESKYTSDIGRLRIYIERAFARVKQFQIFAKTLKITQSDLAV